MTQTDILVPAAVLVLWTLVMLGWLVVTRLPAMKAKGIDMGARPGGRGQDLEGVLDPQHNWPAHNYAHLVEQPTLFYATVAILAIADDAHPLNLGLAWGYVGLRIIHSLVQVTSNRVPIRFVLFVLSTLALIALAVHALMAAI